ncbi:uncharacterized protein LOC124632990 [Helicoverpa zea]|uniref:uncharacterized protein LOC124632990 n=1 Tax=Helicoverpa zea TaxID=7113 RepID=UPI001F57F6A6|nr:uncharacterized protein LOC124632990 [Helicoverpa zea]
MEFLDSLDLDTIDKKSHRVRSWYLYEQYKSLERSQLDAAQKLKDRSYQERILRQELSERRARRKLYDQFGLCHSESRLKKERSDSTRSSVSASNDDFFESFCVLQDDERVTQITGTEFSEDSFSQDGLSASKCCINDFKTEEHKDDCSYTESVNSVVENLKPFNDEFLPTKENMELSQNSIVEDINMQLDSVKEDIICLENLAKIEDVDKISEDESLNTVDECESKPDTVSEKTVQEYNNNVIAIWSRLVSFAYQVVQLNHGNCYCDYSSQFLTAVLACDVLRRGVNRMCNILQPYVSPIKFATDDSDVSNPLFNLNIKRKKLVQSRKCRKICDKPLSSKKAKTWSKTRRSNRKYSENCWQPLSKNSIGRTDTYPRTRHASEPWRSAAKFYTSRDEYSLPSSASSSIWPDIWQERVPKLSRKRYCCYHNKALNPMLKIAHYIDRILKDIDDSKHDM